MLPWLVIPLIGLWALSQLLPPAFRFEITSPRLACVLVLLVTLFWYEVLMPQLSAWRIKRNARLRERKRFEAIEMHKLRKTATRRCRNCLTPYRDQNPGGGKFMCSYCGHISKRPVLDLPVSSDMSNSGILKDLVGKGGKILNGKAWDNGWICGQDWLDNGNWSGGNSSNWNGSGGGPFGGDDQCLAEESYSGLFIYARKSIMTFFLSVMRLWKNFFWISPSRADASAEIDRQRMLDKQGGDGVNGQESRGEKSRRKAEEKRQARLEKEQLEEGERKQREEVARLVEERRRLRDEKMEAEREYGKGSPCAKGRDTKKEAERKRRERKKERDTGSSKSNSDVEELEKKAGKENDRNKNSESDRHEQHRNTPESMKARVTEIGHGVTSVSASNHNRGNAGTRYFDRMRGTFLSSSRAFSGRGLFGKSTSTSNFSKEHKPTDHTQSPVHKKEMVQTDPLSGRSNVNGDHKSNIRPVLIEPPPCPAPKKSWQQLFTRSSAVSPTSNSSVISRPTERCQAEIHTPAYQSQPTPTQSFDNPISFGLPSPFTLSSLPLVSNSNTTHLPSSSEAMLPNIRDSPHQFLLEESEIFEDPSYVPNPVSLLGPVSESLDDFQLDLGLATEKGAERLHSMKASEVTKPSPIEAPLSRFRVSEERHPCSSLFPSTLRALDNSNNMTDNGTWQMWNSSPLVQDGLGLVGGHLNWLLPPEVNVRNSEDIMHPVPHKTMASLFKKDENTIPAAHLQPALFGNYQNGGAFNTVPCNVDGQWPPKTFPGMMSSNETPVPLQPNDEVTQNGLIYGNLPGYAANPQFELPTTNSWGKKDTSGVGARDGIGNSPSPMNRPTPTHVGGLYSPPDVHSLWSYD
ncbi:hypothetical protein C2S53_009701 [Perilla frutescens var. hirtella]|uniref:Stress response NST1-like protein n=1 Tax=Perilla frutescens var. hirtella TaxID=608512 RepID=A0AAD4J019_PERFH|nr:hypothetical protein C2S53_009701 [Perilla frutescens var. hirtella]